MSDKKVSDKKAGAAPRVKDTGFAVACWILVALILLVFFFVKKDTIVSNLRHTNFVNRVMGRVSGEDETAHLSATENTGSVDENGGEVADDELEVAIDMSNISESVENNSDVAVAPSVNSEDEGIHAVGTTPVDEESASASPLQSIEKKPVPRADEDAAHVRPMPKPVITESAAKPDVATMNVKLCFVVIDSDGMVSRRISERALPKTTSPLTASINALLAGPTDGSQTLIPDGTRLLGAEVRGGLATLNFSEEFAFNPMGVEGYMAQLMQVVYTATAFSTVSSVQFVINGQHVDYLGSEGEWIGSPLSRASFR